MDRKDWNDEKKYFFLRKDIGLSHREVDIAKAMIEEKTDKGIGARLNISHKTVHTHRMNIYKKTDCHDRGDFICYLISKGWKMD